MEPDQGLAAIARREGEMEAHDGFGQQQRLVIASLRHGSTNGVPGADRSLAKLHRHYRASASGNGPCLRTLASWSTLYGWAKASAEHDDSVGAALRSRLRETAVQQQFDRVGALTIVAQRALGAVIEKMSAGEVTVATASDIKALVSSAIDAIRLCEVLTGGVSDREEHRGGIAEEALTLLREIEEQKRERASTPSLTMQS